MSRRDSQQITRQAKAKKPGQLRADGSCLVVMEGPRVGHCVHLHAVPVVIGRAPKADFQIEHESVSRLHCSVWQDGSLIHIRDLGSKNGTWVNGFQVATAELDDADHIALGEVVLKFVAGGSLEARYHEALYGLATLDSLTELHNRREFRDSLNEAVRRFRDKPGALSVVIFDLDHFKQINDVLGHDAGDGALRRLSEILRGKLREGDMAGRLGGDEFAVLLPQTDQASALAWCEELRAALEGMGLQDSGLPVKVTVSLGVATWAPEMETGREMLRLADMALLRAKAAGRNCVRAAIIGE